jgi:hypothetical protein
MGLGATIHGAPVYTACIAVQGLRCIARPAPVATGMAHYSWPNLPNVTPACCHKVLEGGDIFKNSAIIKNGGDRAGALAAAPWCGHCRLW